MYMEETPMIKIYVNRLEVQTAEGIRLSRNSRTVKAAREGRVSRSLLQIMWIHGIRPALGEEVAIVDRTV